MPNVRMAQCTSWKRKKENGRDRNEVFACSFPPLIGKREKSYLRPVSFIESQIRSSDFNSKIIFWSKTNNTQFQLFKERTMCKPSMQPLFVVILQSGPKKSRISGQSISSSCACNTDTSDLRALPCPAFFTLE